MALRWLSTNDVVAWRHACATVGQRLGPPAQIHNGTDHEAIWRLGSRQLRVQQSDDFDSMSLYDTIYVWIEPDRSSGTAT